MKFVTELCTKFQSFDLSFWCVSDQISYIAQQPSTDMTYADDIFKLIFFEESCCIFIQISLIFIINVSLMISHLWVRHSRGVEQVTSHFLNGLWHIWLGHICVTLPHQIWNLFHPCSFYQYANWNVRYQPTPPLKDDWENIWHRLYHWIGSVNNYRATSRLASSQWETSLQSNAASLWLGANLESAEPWMKPLFESGQKTLTYHNCMINHILM